MNQIEEHWPVISFILLFIFSVYQHWSTNNSRLKEIKLQFYHRERIDSVKSFLANYVLVSDMFRYFPVYQAFQKKMTSKEMDKEVFPLFNEFKSSVLTASLFTDGRLYECIHEIEEKMIEIEKVLREEYFNDDDEYMARVNRYVELKENNIKACKAIIKEIDNLSTRDLKV